MAANQDKLVRMANQIADFFVPYPHEEQVREVRKHMTAFWSPVMKRDLFALIAAGEAGLRPVVVEAAESMPRP